jgi:hypothetical protein
MTTMKTKKKHQQLNQLNKQPNKFHHQLPMNQQRSLAKLLTTISMIFQTTLMDKSMVSNLMPKILNKPHKIKPQPSITTSIQSEMKQLLTMMTMVSDKKFILRPSISNRN